MEDVIRRLAMAALLIAASACNQSSPSTKTGTPEAVVTPRPTASARGTPPDLSTWETWFPVDIGPRGAGPHCGFRDGIKLAGMLDVPQERSPGLWSLTGCFEAPGSTFYDVLVHLRFADGTIQNTRVLDHSDPTAESVFTVEARASSVSGLTARIYFNQSRR
jgi:hypothetical protein